MKPRSKSKKNNQDPSNPRPISPQPPCPPTTASLSPTATAHQFFFVLPSPSDLSSQQLSLVPECIGLTCSNRPLKSLSLFSQVKELRWLQLISCGLTDAEVSQLKVVQKLETLVLTGNRVAKRDGVLELGVCARLGCLGLAANPIVADLEAMEEIRAGLDLKLLMAEQTQANTAVFDIRKDCAVIEYRNTKSIELAKDLIWQVFDMDNRQFIDLRKYLRDLKSQTKSAATLIYTFFSSCRRFSLNNPRIISNYPSIPWLLLEQWPEQDFITPYAKYLHFGELQRLFEQNQILESRQLPDLISQLLDEYYVSELEERFDRARKGDLPRVEALVGFVFGKAAKYFQRNQDRYQRFVQYSYGREDVTKEMAIYFVKNPEEIAVLQAILSDRELGKEMHTKANKLLEKIKYIKITKLLDTFRQYSAKSLPFCDSNLDFFNQVLKAADLVAVRFDLSKTDRTQIFSDFLFDAFNIRDYDDFAQFLAKSQTRSEEYFQKNINKLKQITKIWNWLRDLQELQKAILTVPQPQQYQTTSIYFKRLIGRPQIDIRLLKQYFPRFDFQLIERLIDSQARHTSLQILMSQFKNDFSFLFTNLLTGTKNPSIDRTKTLLKQISQPTPSQLRFLLTALNITHFIEQQTAQNPLFQCLVKNDMKQYPLLSICLKQETDADQMELFEQTSEQKLYNYEKKYLLRRLRGLVRYDEKDLWMENRGRGAFVMGIRKLADQTVFKDNRLVVELMEFSSDLYNHSLEQTTEKYKHNGLLKPSELDTTKTVQSFLQKLDNGHCITDYLLSNLKQQLYQTIFTYQQGSLTLNVMRYKQLSRAPVIEEFISKEVIELFDAISDNSVQDFIEIRVESSSGRDFSHDYMVTHVLTPGKSKEDQFYLKNLKEAYYDSIIKYCLKKDMSNLEAFYPKMVKVEESFLKKGSGKSRIPLLEISQIVKQRQFKNSQLSRKLIKYFKTKIRTQQSSRQITDQYNKLIKVINQSRKNDAQLLRIITDVIQKNQLRVFKAFLDNLTLFIDVKERFRIYWLTDWNLYESFVQHNHRSAWNANFEYLEKEMEKYQRIFIKYLTRPQEIKPDKAFVQKACKRLENLVLNFEIDCIINDICKELGISFAKPLNYKMITNKIHHFFMALKTRFPAIPWLDTFNYQFCNAVKQKLNHAGFIDLKQYFCSEFTKKPRLQPLLQLISYKVEYYTALKTIDDMYQQRSYKPTQYPQYLLDSLDKLSTVSSINTDIEQQIVKRRYPLLPWQFLNLNNSLKTGYWLDIITGMEKKYGIYLQLLQYLETEDKSETHTLGHLDKAFDFLHSEMCADDMIGRIREVLGCQKEDMFEWVLQYPRYQTVGVAIRAKVKDYMKSLKTMVAGIKPDNSQLLSILRIFALRGEYLTRLEKINNRLRNLLSDFDQASIDIQDYFSRSVQPINLKELFSSLIKMLQILFTYKLDFFQALHSRRFSSFKNLNFNTAWKSYKQVNMMLTQVQTINSDSVITYFKTLLKQYQRDVRPNPTYRSTNYQQAEFYHIAIFTSLRDRQKYEYLTQKPEVKELLERNKEGFRNYRNYLAHYNCCETLRRREGDKEVVMDRRNREELLWVYDGIVRRLIELWR